TILNSIGIKPLAIEKFTRWRFRWDRLERSCRIEGMDSFVLEKIDANDEMDSFIFHLQLFLSEDLSRRPPLEEAASRLKTSPRSL
ncbi:MAG: hypothetical protein GWO08_23550, partial [Gammaproteobacteria bacterium]|nr:hypothetical protein [candidate division Zixibacteria bacterium]NIR96496.1 hypothetical protein [Gammaproteobacteria bacterium]NIS49498.1 hypothetical protein [candidate division Zixibacteria bacterium]NIU17577.1 hypothetical protein [candidate division Zixibacteria bacterium]NIV09728.1 hypothetical protein [candidate division Zixibacteria bacterium]